MKSTNSAQKTRILILIDCEISEVWHVKFIQNSSLQSKTGIKKKQEKKHKI